MYLDEINRRLDSTVEKIHKFEVSSVEIIQTEAKREVILKENLMILDDLWTSSNDIIRISEEEREIRVGKKSV